MSDFDPKNPVFIPERDSSVRRTCPKCGSPDFNGRRIQGGSVTFTCADPKCRNQWTGGLPMMDADPRLPTPPTNPRDRPTVSFTSTIDPKTGERKIREETNSPDPTQSFRRGAFIPDEE